MHFSVIVPFILAAAVGAQDATPVNNNPLGAQYLAIMPAGGNAGIDAQFVAQSTEDGDGVMFMININGEVQEGGPFMYHIHENPVPDDGNCTATGGHLDPFGRGDATACDASAPESCQVGDLSGKYGTIPALPGFSAAYTDTWVSLVPGLGSFIGDRSIVLHTANKTRLACANFFPTNNTVALNGTTSTPKPATSSSDESASETTTTEAGGTVTSADVATSTSSARTVTAPTTTSSYIPSAATNVVVPAFLKLAMVVLVAFLM
ncbi:Cu,Zn superoxide dismutase-like protein [Trichodelitschia bisporula]|uniref:superoxide dismutase n=1 Tax=Trichodelitschia bisporula TaxID=703511 RepID=A0A6G1HL92_9PEZI|nr:Cu,Zn superoxide dismutase-like protein [Trichodelitschia bisporula]